MILASLLFAFLAAALHVFIFTMESLTWTRPATWKRFGIASQSDAETTKPMAYNQGFYNLFLAVGAIVGIGLRGDPEAFPGCRPGPRERLHRENEDVQRRGKEGKKKGGQDHCSILASC